MPVETKAQIFKDMKDNLELVDALWAGTKAMRDAGKKYLPQEPAEETENYKTRKERTYLTNMFKKTINTFAGKIFEQPARIDDFPALDEFAENVDMEGRDFNRFAYDFSRSTLRDGIRFILIDAPSTEGIETALDERSAGVRPYWVEVDIRNVLGVKTIEEGGRITITQFRMIESVTEPVDEFTDKEVEQIRVIEPLKIRLYRKDAKNNWKLHDEIITSYPKVPVEPVFGDRQGYFNSTPPLMDIAWKNLEHWQKGSDQSNILHVARVPILHWSGYSQTVDADGNNADITVGPNSLARSADPQSKLQWVEHSGKAIEAGRQDLMDIKDDIQALGGEFTYKKSNGLTTATENIIDESGDNSELEAFAMNLQDSLTNAVAMTVEMMGMTFTGEVFVNTDIDVINTPVNVTELVKLRAIGDVSREGVFEILNDQWGTNLNAEVEAVRIESEPAKIEDAV